MNDLNRKLKKLLVPLDAQRVESRLFFNHDKVAAENYQKTLEDYFLSLPNKNVTSVYLEIRLPEGNWPSDASIKSNKCKQLTSGLINIGNSKNIFNF